MNQITVAMLQAAYPSYSGANLILAYIPNVWFLELYKTMSCISL